MITREHIVWAYRLLLEREPESEQVIVEKSGHRSLGAMVEGFMDSVEFRQKHQSFSVNSNKWVLVDHDLGFRIWVNLADLAISWAIINNAYEVPEVRFVKRHIREGDSVVDIGANIGFFSLLFSRLVGMEGRVVGFEPLNFLHEAAQKSIRENNFMQCKIHNVALGAPRGSAHLVYAPASSNWGGAFLSFDRHVPPNHTSISVPVAPLGDFVEGFRVDFFKIDVEGAEPLVIDGCLEYLSDCKPIIMSEIHRQQLMRVCGVSAKAYIDRLRHIGYSCHIIDSAGNLGAEIRGDEPFELINVAFVS